MAPRITGNLNLGGGARTLEQRRADRLSQLADLRWRRCQTMAYDGEASVPADPALSVITSIAVAEQFAPSNGAVRTFKLASPGVFRQWTVSQIVAYGMAIGAHVQACFDQEAALASLILAAEDEAALAAIDINGGWPT